MNELISQVGDKRNDNKICQGSFVFFFFLKVCIGCTEKQSTKRQYNQ